MSQPLPYQVDFSIKNYFEQIFFSFLSTDRQFTLFLSRAKVPGFIHAKCIELIYFHVFRIVIEITTNIAC